MTAGGQVSVSMAVEGATQLWTLVLRDAWRQARQRLRAGPVYRWRYSGRTPERVLIAPPDLRLADPQIALEIYYGRFPLAGHLVDTGGRSPFQVAVAHPGWRRSLHGFRWLRHMRAAGTELASANARALVSDWITTHGRRISGQAWDPGTTAKRIIAWLQHSSIVLQGAEFAFYRAFLRSLAMQIRFLRSLVREMAPGKDRLRARVALCFAALSLPTPGTALRQASRALSDELDLQILPDGGHVSRNPLAVLELLSDLLPLRYTYASQAETPPSALVNAVDRMLPALRFFRHEDGSLARFNGMGATIHDRIAAILRLDDAGGRPLLHSPYAGYERLALGGTTVIADTGMPPAPEMAGAAHAGCLSIEFSSGRHNFVVNCGVDTFGSQESRPLSRATAAHSTATINDSSSARFGRSARMNERGGAPLIGGPKKVPVKRLDESGQQGFVASHDGYVSRFGLVHERRVTLSGQGSLLSGADRFLGSQGAPPRRDARDQVVVRFHLHPEIQLFADEDGGLVLAAPRGDRWVFSAAEVAPVVEESIFFADLSGPRRSRQIVLAFQPADTPTVHWQFAREQAG